MRGADAPPACAQAVASTFTAAASFITVFEIAQHAAYYHKPIFQKQICRLLALVPIYGVCSLTSLISPRAGKYVDVLRDCYECVCSRPDQRVAPLLTPAPPPHRPPATER
jgi:Organic solute transporter Ostalpha